MLEKIAAEFAAATGERDTARENVGSLLGILDYDGAVKAG